MAIQSLYTFLFNCCRLAYVYCTCVKINLITMLMCVRVFVNLCSPACQRNVVLVEVVLRAVCVEQTADYNNYCGFIFSDF